MGTHQEIGSYNKLIGATVIVQFYSSSSNREEAISVAYSAVLLPSSFKKGRYVTNTLPPFVLLVLIIGFACGCHMQML